MTYELYYGLLLNAPRVQAFGAVATLRALTTFHGKKGDPTLFDAAASDEAQGEYLAKRWDADRHVQDVMAKHGHS